MNEMIPNFEDGEKKMSKKDEYMKMYRKKYYEANKEKLNKERCEKSRIAHLKITKQKKLQKVLKAVNDGIVPIENITDILGDDDKLVFGTLIDNIKALVEGELQKIL